MKNSKLVNYFYNSYNYSPIFVFSLILLIIVIWYGNPDENIPKLSSKGPKLNENVINSEKFNPLLYDFPFYSKKSHYYRVSQTDFLVVVNPQELE